MLVTTTNESNFTLLQSEITNVDIDVLGEHHFRIFGNVSGQIGRCADFEASGGAVDVEGYFSGM